MNFIIVLLIGFSSWLWPMHFQDWGCEEDVLRNTFIMDIPAGEEPTLGVTDQLAKSGWVYNSWPGEYDGTTWIGVSEDVVLYNSPIYVERCTPLFDAKDEYRWFCTGKWKVPGPCRSHKGEDGKIHTTCVQCYSQADTGLYRRIKCPSMDVDELLKITGQKMEEE